MASKRNMHLPRNSLRSKRQHDSLPQPIPTVSVERPIIWDAVEDEQAYIASCQKAVGKSVKAKHRGKHAIIAPQSLALVQLNHEPLASQNVTYHWFSARQEVAERLAYLLQDRLDTLLKSAPRELTIGLGHAALLKTASNSHDSEISFGLDGWRGQRARYAQTDATGQLNPLFQLKKESELYEATLKEAYEWFEPKDVIAEPRIAVIGSRGSIEQEMRKINERLSDEPPIPGIVRFGDPVITLRNGRETSILAARREFVSPLAA